MDFPLLWSKLLVVLDPFTRNRPSNRPAPKHTHGVTLYAPYHRFVVRRVRGMSRLVRVAHPAHRMCRMPRGCVPHCVPPACRTSPCDYGHRPDPHLSEASDPPTPPPLDGPFDFKEAFLGLKMGLPVQIFWYFGWIQECQSCFCC